VSLEPDQQFVVAKVAYLSTAFASALAKGEVAGHALWSSSMVQTNCSTQAG
jgi:hypothetical protein